jgi:RNA polymerase sigma-70 factor (ECF subfamily)
MVQEVPSSASTRPPAHTAPLASLAEELAGLRALAGTLVRGDAELELDDALQDAAVDALTHPPSAPGPLRPWLFVVVRNRVRMARRAARRRRAREQAVGEATPHAVVGADASLERVQGLQRLGQALAALPAPLRDTVLARYFDGHSAADIARQQGVPAGTVRYRLHAALTQLRADLDDDTPRARWVLALTPFVPIGAAAPAGSAASSLATSGVAVMKAKTSIVIVILVLLALAGVLTGRWLAGRGDDAATGPAATGAGVAATGPGASPTTPGAPSLAGGSGAGSGSTVAASPGQGRAVVEPSPSAGGAIAGRVVNWSTGEGVVDAELGFSDDGGAVTTVRTGPAGAFELVPPAPARYRLATATATGFLPYAPPWRHSQVSVTALAGKRVAGVTIFLFPALDYQGVVVDEAGAPVVGAEVRRLANASSEQALDRLDHAWVTDGEGAFTFHAPDYSAFEARQGNRRGRAVLDGSVALTKVLVIRLTGAPASDRVIAGRVVGPDGQPVPDALVHAQPAAPAITPPPAGPGAPPPAIRASGHTTSDDDGRFEITGLDGDGYDLVAIDDERPGAVVTGVAGGSRDVVLTFALGAAVRGQVHDSSGAPVPEFTVLVARRDGAARIPVAAVAVVAAGGDFSVPVAPGEYEVTATAPGWAPSAPVLATAGGAEVSVTVPAGATLVGRVVDKVSGEPLEYARVMREGGGGGASARPSNAGTVTRADGTFTLSGLPPGRVSITVAGGGYHPRIVAGLSATEGGTIGPLEVALKALAPGEQPKLEVVGIGLGLSPHPKGLLVDRVVPGGGAEAAGVQVGDIVTSVDGAATTETGLEGAVLRIRGNEGTTLRLGLLRADAPLELVVERRPLPG